LSFYIEGNKNRIQSPLKVDEEQQTKEKVCSFNSNTKNMGEKMKIEKATVKQFLKSIICFIAILIVVSSGQAQQGLSQKQDEIYYENQAQIYYERGDIEHAILLLKKALEINPKYANAYNGLGYIYGARKNYDQAIQNFTKAIEYYPTFWDAYLRRGRIYLEIKKDFDKAIADYSKIIELNPQIPIAFFERGC
jgi:tetratricopeptide (TPR) repeat protein